MISNFEAKTYGQTKVQTDMTPPPIKKSFIRTLCKEHIRSHDISDHSDE